MNLSFMFFVTALGFGVGLAMDAFSVSLANGLSDPKMKARRMCLIAGTFAFFQALMPLIGWFLIHTIAERFKICEKLIPWIALVLLLYIGGKMLIEGIKGGEEESGEKALTVSALLIQGIATSIDALSVGFGIPEYNFAEALLSVLIIAAMTFAICMFGLTVGKKFGTHMAGKATILGGVILIAIGIEVFITGII